MCIECLKEKSIIKHTVIGSEQLEADAEHAKAPDPGQPGAERGNTTSKDAGTFQCR